jgi:hypothetical protein
MPNVSIDALANKDTLEQEPQRGSVNCVFLSRSFLHFGLAVVKTIKPQELARAQSEVNVST